MTAPRGPGRSGAGDARTARAVPATTSAIGSSDRPGNASATSRVPAPSTVKVAIAVPSRSSSSSSERSPPAAATTPASSRAPAAGRAAPGASANNSPAAEQLIEISSASPCSAQATSPSGRRPAASASPRFCAATSVNTRPQPAGPVTTGPARSGSTGCSATKAAHWGTANRVSQEYPYPRPAVAAATSPT